MNAADAKASREVGNPGKQRFMRARDRLEVGKEPGKRRESLEPLPVSPPPGPLAHAKPRRRAAPTAADRGPADLAPDLAPARVRGNSREGQPATLPHAAAPMASHEAAVIAAAVAILDARLRAAGPG